MDSKVLKELESFTRLFSETADHVNDHSKKRKQFADRINQDIMKAAAIATDIFNEIKRVAQANMEWREKDNTINSTIQLLISNIDRQKTTLSFFRENKIITGAVIDEMESIIDLLADSLKRATESLSTIIAKENDIILLDSLLEYKKKYQLESLRTLKKLADAIASDAYAAISGSNENRERGIRLSENLKALSDNQSAEIIERMIADIKSGRAQAENVLKNSKSQEEFNDQVMVFTSDFISECDAVKNLVNQKHQLFEENLQIITVFTVILSFEFKKYIAIQKQIEKIQMPDSMRDEYLTFMVLVDIACKDIKNLTELNYDMTETSHKTNEGETRTVEMSEDELAIFLGLRDLLKEMTEMTKVPVEGAVKNIENATKIEKLLFQLTGGSIDTPESEMKTNAKSINEEERVMASKKTIMVIDDGAAIRQVVSQVLSSDGFETIEAVDGQDALNKLDGKKIDMFVCDVNMPNLNGIQFLEAIRTDEKYREYRFTPIVMLTTEAGESMKEKGKQLGAKAWIVKPFQPDHLLEKIKPLIG